MPMPIEVKRSVYDAAVEEAIKTFAPTLERKDVGAIVYSAMEKMMEQSGYELGLVDDEEV